jgi:hypothetical protein
MQMSFSCAAIAAETARFLGGGGAGMVGSWSTAARNTGQRPPVKQLLLLQASFALILHAKVRMYHVHRLGRAWKITCNRFQQLVWIPPHGWLIANKEFL